MGDEFASQGRVDSFYICFGDHNAVVARGNYQKPEMLVPSEQYMQDTLLTPPPTKNSGDSVEGEHLLSSHTLQFAFSFANFIH